ncbi:hypothetical protein QQ008_09625 [Fulvivirgaceae bacterium BMA10]|uniref:Uncharacterized protein n=1 Tax=Splendidivirga corallicola TaxID=3051826 RepID=A0ABT8KLL7_9BACT|nr:hypothetical protein [Fulvivirgaceae bacterium BMA10]
MDRKYFLLDKNYILKEAQLQKKSELLDFVIDEVKQSYLIFCNPLGIEDDTIVRIKSFRDNIANNLNNFYDSLAGIFRYKIGTNQLELLFDGESHYEKYLKDWDQTFRGWVNDFCRHERFLKAILEATVFCEGEHMALLADNRLKYFITNYFELKIYKYKGIINMKVA